MLVVPANQPHQAWHQRSEYRRWAEQLFAIASQRRNFRAMIGQFDFIAAVDYSTKRFYINASVPQAPSLARPRFDPLDEHARLNLTLKALIAHEAGHVRHSQYERIPLTETQHWIWNVLEDERIERLMAAEYPELHSAFTFVGDAICARSQSKFTYTVDEGILMWRYAHDQSPPSWQIAPDQAPVWAEIRPLVETAWRAQSAQQVLWIALSIEALLNSQHPPEQKVKDVSPEQKRAQAQTTISQQGGGENEGQSGIDDAAAHQSEPSPQLNDNPQNGEGDTRAEQEEANDQNAGIEQNHKSGQDDGPELGQIQDEAEGAPQANDHAKEQTAHDCSSNAAPEQSAASPAPYESPAAQKYFDLASATGANTPPDEPEESAATASEVHETQTRSLQSSATGAGDEDGLLPPPPASQPQEGRHIADGVERHARELAPLLRPRELPGFTVPHKSRGKYSYGRHSSGKERIFENKQLPSRPAPIFVDIILDHSSSMTNEGRIEAARQAALMIRRASYLAHSRSRITVFNHRFSVLCEPAMPYEESAALIAGLKPVGNTQLAPALYHCLTHPPVGDELHFVTIICDGDLTPRDQQNCQQLMDALKQSRVTQKPRILPLLIGNAANKTEPWRQLFGSATPCEDAAKLALHIKTVLTTYRAKHLPPSGVLAK